MNSPIAQAVALLAALAMGLPAGWCCACYAPPAASATARHSCCQQQEAPVKKTVPHDSVCCCASRIATLPSAALGLDHDAVVTALLPPVATQVAAPAPALLSPAFAPIRPPPRILYCVWRC